MLFNFGFKKVAESEKKNLVSDVFASVASKYSIMNNVMSMNLQNQWKKNFIDFITLKEGGRYLDLACGTGDITLMILEKAKREGKNITITACDPSIEMLEIAKNRLPEVDFIQSFAEDLSFDPEIFDAIFISFGIRNFTNLDAALSKMHSMLKKDSSLYILEFFSDVEVGFDVIYKFYLLNIIPKIGGIVAKDSASYKYFGESILNFHSKQSFIQYLENAGFSYESSIDSILKIVRYFNFKK